MDLDALYGGEPDLYEVAAGRVGQGTGAVAAWKNRLTVHQFRWIFDWIDRYAPPGGSVLDWGCGAGMFSQYLVRAGFAVEALDMVTPLLVDELRQASSAYRFTPAPDPYHLPYEDGSLDVVFSVGVLEHVRDTGGDEVTSLAEIRRVLKENGLLICCHFPNQWSWIDWTARLSNTRHYHDFRYTKSDIVRLTAETCFELKELKRYGILPRNSLGRASPRIGESRVAARLVDAVDDTLGLLLWPIVQNFGFVARAHP